MPRYELRFQIPDRQLGEPEPYRAFGRAVERLVQLRGGLTVGATVEEVHVTGGSLFGSATMEADSYESALALVCRETPIISLQWHLEEEVSPTLTADLLEQAITQALASANGVHDPHVPTTPPELTDDLGHSMESMDVPDLHLEVGAADLGDAAQMRDDQAAIVVDFGSMEAVESLRFFE